MRLEPLMWAAPRLAVRDRRTVHRRLLELGVPVIRLGGRVYVNPDTLDAALAAVAQPPDPGASWWRGSVVAEGERLWD